MQKLSLASDLSIARSSPAGLARYHGRGRWMVARWIAELNAALLEIAAGTLTRLIVEVPPRHGKSELISKYLPAWWLGTFTDSKIILASYESNFAASWGGKARDVLRDVGPKLFGTSIHKTRSARKEWWTEQGGVMLSAGANGPVTGHGARIGIIDDPVRGAADANSKAKRDALWDWYVSTFYTRIEADGAIIVLQTRWHKDDLAGRLQQEARDGGEQWRVLRFPALAEADDPLGRKEGEALCPFRFKRESLLRIKKSLGSYWWRSLYQQKPAADDGELFHADWFKRFRVEWRRPEPGLAEEPFYVMPHRTVKAAACRHFWTVDSALSLRSSSDWTVIAQWALTQKNELLLVKLTRIRVEDPEAVPSIVRELRDCIRKPRKIYVEDLGVFQSAKQRKLNVEKLKADTDKVTRASTFQAMAQDGMVYVNDDSQMVSWEDYRDELIAFPRGAHDDQVDASSYAGIVCAESFGVEYGLGISVETYAEKPKKKRAA